MYGEVIAFIKPNYIIRGKKAAEIPGTEALLQAWGDAMLLAAATHRYFGDCLRPTPQNLSPTQAQILPAPQAGEALVQGLLSLLWLPRRPHPTTAT